MQTNTEGLWRRLGVIIRMIEKSPGRMLGRTAIVKLLYLLQEVRKVPLGYDFRLYTYGPFDSDVLYDLGSGESLQALDVKTVIYPSGYGYQVRPGTEANTVKEAVVAWLDSRQSDIEWTVDKFAGRSAKELELVATIAYVDRELAKQAKPYGLDELARRVREVKPSFDHAYVDDKCAEARNLELMAPSA
jgi:uncharacterized protein